MAFSFNDMRFWFLDDNGSPDFTDYQSYRGSLEWKLWNRKSAQSPADPDPGTESLFSERTISDPLPGFNQGAGNSAKMLVGNYKDFTPGTPGVVPTPQHDLIIDVDDPLIAGFPIWQYTWFAIQNLPSNDDVVRLQIRTNIAGPNFGAAFNTTVHAAQCRILGVVPGTFTGTDDNTGRLAFLNSLSIDASPTLGDKFPHIVTADFTSPDPTYPDMSKIRWNACLEQGGTAFSAEERRVYHAYNNQSNYTTAGDAVVRYPYQIAGWVNFADPDRNRLVPSGGIIPNRISNPRQNFDLPSDHTILGVITKSYDNVNPVNNGPWKTGKIVPEADQYAGRPTGSSEWNIWKARILLAHLVVS